MININLQKGQCYELNWEYAGIRQSLVGKVDNIKIDKYNVKVHFIMPNYKHNGHWRGDNLYKCLWWTNTSRYYQLKDAKIRHITLGSCFILRGLLPRHTTMESYYGDFELLYN